VADISNAPGLTRRIADYAVAAAATPLPEGVVEKAKHHVLDTIAAMVSGAALPPGRFARDYVRGLGGADEASVVGAAFLTSAVNAVLANAMSAHADETDDSHPRSLTHPGCAVVPAALAMAERQGSSGAEFLRAVVLGYDLCARTGMMLGGTRFVHERDFDSHAFGGCFGAAAAAGTLAVREGAQMAHVLSYAAQQAAGLATLFRDAHHVEKAFVFAGMPARNGVAAATMVEAGFTGVADVFDGAPSFLTAFGVAPAGALVFDDLGIAFEITQTNIKRWSVGSPVQAVLDSLEALMLQHHFTAADIAAVAVHLPATSVKVVDNRDMPDINVQHLAALMLYDRTMSFAASHDVKRMTDPGVLALRGKIAIVRSEELDRLRPSRQAIVEITLANRRKLRHHTQAVRGTTDNPMTREEVTAKALDLMTPVLGDAGARRVVERIWELERLTSVSTLCALLQKPGK
jgi:2-methylcitrate dehydratase PrpD